MNMRHLRAFLWLRWRLRVNQLKRGGIANAVILVILCVAALGASVFLFVLFFALGLFVYNDKSPTVLMWLWDAVVVAFLFAWTAGLITDLQRSESLSLAKFLHLPVSLTGIFLINYLSSWASLTLLFFLPAMLGLSLGLILSRGWVMLCLLPMLAAFLLMVTALTYQFQGWLATLMANPRRRRTIIVAATMILVLLSQLPNLVNFWNFRHQGPRQGPVAAPPPIPVEEIQPLRARPEGNKAREERQKIQAEIAKQQLEMLRQIQTRNKKEDEDRLLEIEGIVRVMNLVLPPGWLPAGVEAAAVGNPWPVVLALLGPTLIGTASLYRAYRTTVRLYTGQYTSGKAPSVAVAPTKKAARASSGLLEMKLPWLSEQASVIALAAFRSLLRAPEAKMLLLTPLLFLLIFGSIFLMQTERQDLPETVRELIALGAMAMVQFSMSQLLGNQFGFDRGGFRVYVLSPASRRDILLGKNLAVAPLALTMGAGAAILVQIVCPMRLDHFLALAPRFLSMYLLYCLAANALSILAPMHVPASSFQPARPGAIVLLFQLLFMFLWPIILAPILLPLGIEWVVEQMDWLHGFPLDLLLSLVECAVIACLYYLILGWQGELLQWREQRILQIVTTRAE